MLISEGAEAKVYRLKLYGKDIAAKIREPKLYRERALDIALRSSRTKKEAKAMYKAKKLGVNVPSIIALGRFSIYMEYIEGTLLKNEKRVKKETFEKIGGMLAKLHKDNIAHGDFTPANLMLSNNEIYVIDFGLAEMSSSVEEKALDLLLMKRSINALQYKAFERGYIKQGGEKEVLKRLAEIMLRGRYQTRTLLTE